jgi:hypothetical protein
VKSLFNANTEQEIIQRIQTLSIDSKALWGKMNISQMLEHVILCEDMYLGTNQVKRVFIGRILGGTLFKMVLKNDKPFTKGSPTAQELTPVGDAADVESQKSVWISKIQENRIHPIDQFIHPFFGSMNKEQIGYLNFKHIDHHLRQFGA